MTHAYIVYVAFYGIIATTFSCILYPGYVQISNIPHSVLDGMFYLLSGGVWPKNLIHMIWWRKRWS